MDYDTKLETTPTKGASTYHIIEPNPQSAAEDLMVTGSFLDSPSATVTSEIDKSCNVSPIGSLWTTSEGSYYLLLTWHTFHWQLNLQLSLKLETSSNHALKSNEYVTPASTLGISTKPVFSP